MNNILHFPTPEQIHQKRIKMVCDFLKKGRKDKVLNKCNHGIKFSPVEQFEGHCLYLRYLMAKGGDAVL